MKKLLKKWSFAEFIFTGISGVFLHFLYELSGENRLASLFSAVNESIWEHMKLLFVPLFLFALIEYAFVGKKIKNFWCVKLVGTLCGLLLIPVIYYTYTGIIGVNADWFNIAIYFISAGAVCFLENLIFKNNFMFCKRPWFAFGVLCLTGVLFIVMTFVPPQIPLFQDPVNGTYGI